MQDSIGGYFEMELPHKKEYHNKAIRLNTGRNAFEYILRVKRYSKVYLPYYTCEAMLEPIKKLQIDFEQYYINHTFRPIFDFERLRDTEVFVYNNYYGICDQQVIEVANKCSKLIIDNSQAFYSKPIEGVDTFYSPRKFFGIADGAYLYTNRKIEQEFKFQESYSRYEYLLGRIDLCPERFYDSFLIKDHELSDQPIMSMSNLTRRILQSIDYSFVSKKRLENFFFLNKHLEKLNQLTIKPNVNSVPMVYPLLFSNGNEIKKKLLQNKIYVATYWPNVFQWCNKGNLEFQFANDIIPLPIDQRYGRNEMEKILEILCHQK